jgi:D-beta-D-heptose 7-phosphate kinase/D-beta-D-heptose 1-phosphate adenosyltransferase
VNNIHSLGGEVFVAGVIGEDKVGERLVNELKNKGINVEGLIVDRERPTTLKTRIIAHNQQVVRVDREKREAINTYITGQILTYVHKVLPEIGAVVLSDYGKGVITPRLLEEIIPLAKRNDKIIVVDPKISNYLNYKYATVICPNKVEASALTKMEIKDEESLKEVGLQILRDLECDAVLITRGEEGMSLFEGETVVHIPTVAREVYDVTGAGDTVVSTLALALSSGANMHEASILANYAAGVVVGEVGTATVTPDELRSEVKKGLHLR